MELNMGVNSLDELICKMKECVGNKDWKTVTGLVEKYYKPIFIKQEQEHRERVDLYQREIELLKAKLYEAREESGYKFIGNSDGYNYFKKVSDQ